MTSSGLNVVIGEDDYEGLTGVMGHLMAIKDRQPTTDVMFEPLKETIELLQSYGHTMSDEVHQQLEVQYHNTGIFLNLSSIFILTVYRCFLKLGIMSRNNQW